MIAALRVIGLVWVVGVLTLLLVVSALDAAQWALQSGSLALRDIGEVTVYGWLWMQAMGALARNMRGGGE